MCAEYQINKEPSEIREYLKRHGESDSENTYRPRIKLFSDAPVVIDEEMKVEMMRFSQDQPCEFIRKIGHHRQPVILKQQSFAEWLSADLDSNEALRLLNLQQQPLDLKVKTDRKMAKGWEKRVAAFVEKSEKELIFEKIMRDDQQDLHHSRKQ
jgi:putative SOS response-associated peptidase YedK